MLVLRHDGGCHEMLAEQLRIRCTRARPLQPIVCCPEFNPPTLALTAADPRFDPLAIDIHEVNLVAIGEFAAKPSIRGRSEIIDRLR